MVKAPDPTPRQRTICWDSRLMPCPLPGDSYPSPSSGTTSSRYEIFLWLMKYFCDWWNVFIQLTSALRYIHAAGLACRTLDPTKILVLGKHRLLVNCGGIFDVLTFDPNSSNPMAAMAVYQQVSSKDRNIVKPLSKSKVLSLPSKVQADDLSSKSSIWIDYSTY